MLPRSVLAVLIVPLLCAAAAAQRPGTGGGPAAPPEVPETGIGPASFASFTGPGADFVQGSSTTRAGTISCPLQLTVPALPPGAVELQAYASWNWLAGAPPATDTISVNGVSVTGSLAGSGQPDLCWSKSEGSSYLAALPAGLVLTGGANTIDGACDRALGTDPAALGEGITLLVVYDVAAATARTVDLWAGYTSTRSNASGRAQASLSFSAAYPGGPAHLFLNALDGQTSGDDLYLNGQLASGAIPGTVAPGDAWQGLSGPQPTDNLYDAAEGDAAAFFAQGDVSLLVETTGNGDCVGHSLAALARDVGCGTVATYCTGKVNSQGCVPAIGASGTPSASAPSGYAITQTNHRPGRFALLFYSKSGPSSAPFQGGTLCAAPPLRRTPGSISSGSGACGGVHVMDFNAWIASGNDPALAGGQGVWCQWWGRDSPGNTSLSDALHFLICS